MTRKRNKVIKLVSSWKVTTSTKGIITTKDEGMITTIVNSMSTSQSSTTAKTITGKVTDQNTTITRTTKSNNRVNVNTSPKDQMKKASTPKIGSMKERTLTRLMTQESHKNNLKIVVNTHLKTSRVSSRMWIQATRKCTKKWKIKPRPWK